MTDTSTRPDADTEPVLPDTGTGLFAPRARGRHRRPRPRKVLFAAGGLALAAGVLSLVRMTPESGVGGYGATEAEPRPDDPGADGDTDRSTVAAATVPKVAPSATSVMGGVSASPTPGVSLVPVPSVTAAPAWAPPPDATTIPQATNPPAPTATPHRPAPTTAAPQPTHTSAPAPTATPSRTTPAPTQTPGGPGLCVPIIGLCVDPLVEHDHGHDHGHDH